MVLGKCKYKYGMNVNWSLLQQVKVSLLPALFIISPLIILVRSDPPEGCDRAHAPEGYMPSPEQIRQGVEGGKEEAS